MDLIKTVRGLDQKGPGDDGENLQLLWNQLASSADTQFHAAEESSLRWLLKLMNGSTPAAETMRRYPLSWTILECIFRRMPLLSLAKCLSFRKFVAVLQQTVTDLAAPTHDETIAKPGKRKRDSTLKYELEHLKSARSRLQGAHGIFKTLKALLDRVGNVSAQDKIGAEHIRSLFCTSAADMIKIVNPLFALCGFVLDNADNDGQLEDSVEWISIIAAVWNLHLQGESDADEVATHLLGGLLILISRLDGLGGNAYPKGSVQQRWSSDTHAFLSRAVTHPAKTAFVSQQSQAIIAIALDINSKRLDVIAPALYHVLSASSLSSEVRRRKGEVEWMEDAFRAIEGAIRPLQGREELLKSLLRRAAEMSTPIKVEDLRLVCHEYALKDQIHWDILALAVACDADIFQVTEAGKGLLNTVCTKLLAETCVEGQTYTSMSLVVDGIFRGFRISRDIPSFLKLWYGQMCQAESTSAALQSPWFQVGQSSGQHSLCESIEQQMSPQQLVDVLAWITADRIHQQALSVFLAAVSEGVKSESFADAVCNKVFELWLLVEDSKSGSWATALRWATISRSLSWFPSDQRGDVWTVIQKSLSKVLKKSEIESADCFEAFKCCCQAWSSMSPDDVRLPEPLALLQTFSKRLTAQISECNFSDHLETFSPLTATRYDFSKSPRLMQYIAWYFWGHPRLVHLSISHKEVIPLVPEVAAKVSATRLQISQSVWEALIENDQLWQNAKVASEVIHRLTMALEDSTKAEALPYSNSRKLLHLFSNVPSDAFSRPQRERVMATLIGKPSTSPREVNFRADMDDWRCLLSIISKLAVRPTFYEGMRFEHLTSVADALCEHILRGNPADDLLLEIIERTTDIFTTTFKQMTENVDERSLKYLSEGTTLLSTASEQVSRLDKGTDLNTSLPLRITTLKAFITQLAQSVNCSSNEALATLLKQAQSSVSRMIAGVINRWVNEKASRHENTMIFSLYAALDAASSVSADIDLTLVKSSKLRKLDESSYKNMVEGHLRGWLIQIFLRTYMPASVAEPRPNALPHLNNIPQELRESIVAKMMEVVLRGLTVTEQYEYVCSLIEQISDGTEGMHGQVVAVDKAVRQMIYIGQSEIAGNSFVFPKLYGELIRCLPRISNRNDSSRLCRVLQHLLEASPRPLGQWNIELTLEQLCDLSSQHNGLADLPFTSLCKIVEIVIKKHRLRLEGHYHLLVTLLQALLCKLIAVANSIEQKGPKAQVVLAHAYGRIITLICEPTVGAVSRGQQQGSLSSATDTAKRSAGKHMYLVLMQYVKLQLEGGVARPIREGLESAMNSIFDVTSAESRKILNDAMNASGRAILREMFKRYTKFGKWSGV